MKSMLKMKTASAIMAVYDNLFEIDAKYCQEKQVPYERLNNIGIQICKVIRINRYGRWKHQVPYTPP